MTEFGPPDTFGRVTFCDDIRLEADGKLTLVGCYGADMVFQNALPAVLPKLGILLQFSDLPDAKHEPMTIEMFFPGDPDDKPSVQMNVPAVEYPVTPELAAARDEDTRFAVSMNMVLSPITIQSVGHIKVKLIKGADSYRIGRIRISENRK